MLFRSMDVETEEPLLDGEKPITAQTTFTPKESEGTVDVVFTFDGSSLKGKNTVIYESITQEEKEIGMHADPDFKDQQMFFPEIGTKALCLETGSQMAIPKKELTITDTVSYRLVPGKEYKLIGTLMDKETGEPLLVDGKLVTSELLFTPEEEEGSVELSFTFDASALRGKTIVVFESVSYQEKEVAVHADIESAPQSIYFPEIGTTAKDGKDGDQEAFAEKDTQLVDTVGHKGLVTKDTSYRLVGTLMDKETGKEVQIDGKPVTAETIFQPEKTEGTVDVIFNFDATTLKGHDVVVFEKLYVTMKEEDKEKEVELTNHEDIQAESQTVKLTEVPTEPEKPADTPDAPKTGDTTNLWIPVAVLVAAFAGIVAVIIRIRRKKF